MTMRPGGIGQTEKRRLALAEAFSYFVNPETEAVPRTDLPLLLTIVGVDRADEVLCLLMGMPTTTVTWNMHEESVVAELTSRFSQSKSRQPSRAGSRRNSLEGVKQRRRHSLAKGGTDTGVAKNIQFNAVQGLPSCAEAPADVESALVRSTSALARFLAKEGSAEGEGVARSWIGLQMGAAPEVVQARTDLLDHYAVWCTEPPCEVRLSEIENRVVWGVMLNGTSGSGYACFSKVPSFRQLCCADWLLLQQLTGVRLQVGHFKSLFTFFDENQDGTISNSELRLMMKAVGSTKGVRGTTGKVGLVELMRIMAKQDCSARWVERHVESIKALFLLVHEPIVEEASADGAEDTDAAASPVPLSRAPSFTRTSSLVDQDALTTVDSVAVPHKYASGRLYYWISKFNIAVSEGDPIGGAMKKAGAHRASDQPERDCDLTKPREMGWVGGFASFLQLVMHNPCRELQQLMESVRKFREIFTLFDRDNEGTISVDELTITLTRLFRRRPTQFEMCRLIGVVDSDGSGFIDFSEFSHLMLMKGQRSSLQSTLDSIRLPVEDLHVLFRSFCVDQGVSFVLRQWSVKEFGKVLRCLGDPHTDEQLNDMLMQFEPDGDGYVSFTAFSDRMTAEKPTQAQLVVWEHIGQMRKFFENFDTDGSSSMDCSEMENFIRRLGKSPSEDELNKLVELISPDRVEIDFAGFIELISGNTTDTQKFIQRQIAEFRDAFGLFDPNGDGEVNHEEFVTVLSLFGEAMAQHSEALMDEIDEDRSGDIDFIEFLAMMTCNDSPAQSKLRSQVVSFREMFNMFDTQNKGLISPENFHEAMEGLLMTMDMVEIRQAMERVTGPKQSGHLFLDYTTFVLLFAQSRKDSQGLPLLCQLNELREAFAICDADGSGALDIDEIAETLAAMGHDRTRLEVEALVSEVDEDGTGELDFFEFMTLMAQTMGSANEDAADAAKKRMAGTPSEQLLALLEASPVPRSDARSACVDGIVTLLRGDNFPAIAHLEGLGCGNMEMSKKIAFEMSLETFGPGELLYKQGDAQVDMLLILHGTADAWSRNEQALLLSKHHGLNALWCILKPACLSLLAECRQFEHNFVAQCQLEAHANQSTPIALFVTETQHIARSLFQWTKRASEKCPSELHDLRLNEPLMSEVAQIVLDVRKHTASCDAIRSSLIVRRTGLQLSMSEEEAKIANEIAISVSKVILSALQSWLVTFEMALGMQQVDLSEEMAPGLSHQGIIHNTVTSARAERSTSALEDELFGLRLGELGTPHGIGLTSLNPEEQVAALTVSTRRNLLDRVKEGELVWGGNQHKCSVICARVSRASYLEARAVAPLKLLSQLQFCAGMTKNDMRKLALQMERVTIPKGESVAMRGQLASTVLIVETGRIILKLDVGMLKAQAEATQKLLIEAHRGVHNLKLSLLEENLETRKIYKLNCKLTDANLVVDKLSTQLAMLLDAGATVRSSAGFSEQMLIDYQASVQVEVVDPKQPKFRKRRKSIAVIGELDLLHECEIDADGNSVWASDYVVDSTSAVVWALPRTLFVSPKIQKNLHSTDTARAESRRQRVRASVGVIPVNCEDEQAVQQPLEQLEKLKPKNYSQIPASEEDIFKLNTLKALDRKESPARVGADGTSRATSRVCVRTFGHDQMDFEVEPGSSVHELHQAINSRTQQQGGRPIYLMHNGEWLPDSSKLSECGVLQPDPRTKASAHSSSPKEDPHRVNTALSSASSRHNVYRPPRQSWSGGQSAASGFGAMESITEKQESTVELLREEEPTLAQQLLGHNDKLPSLPPSRCELVRRRSVVTDDNQYMNGRWMGYANPAGGAVEQVSRPWSEGQKTRAEALVDIAPARADRSAGSPPQGADRAGIHGTKPDPLGKAKEQLANWDGAEPIVREVRVNREVLKEARPWSEGQGPGRVSSGNAELLEKASACRVLKMKEEEQMKRRGARIGQPCDRPASESRATEANPVKAPVAGSAGQAAGGALSYAQAEEQAVKGAPKETVESAQARAARIMAITMSSSDDDDDWEPPLRSFEGTPETSEGNQMSACVSNVNLFGAADAFTVTVTDALDSSALEDGETHPVTTVVEMPAVQMDGTERDPEALMGSDAGSVRPVTRGTVVSFDDTPTLLGDNQTDQMLQYSSAEESDWNSDSNSDSDEYEPGFEWLAFYDSLEYDDSSGAHNSCSPFANLPEQTTPPPVMQSPSPKRRSPAVAKSPSSRSAAVRSPSSHLVKSSAFLPPLSRAAPAHMTSPSKAALRNFSRSGSHPSRHRLVKGFANEMEVLATREKRLGQLEPVQLVPESAGFSSTLRAIAPHEYRVTPHSGLVMTPCSRSGRVSCHF